MDRGPGAPRWIHRSRFWFWFCCALSATSGGQGDASHPTLGVSAPHLYYTCPEGSSVTLECSQRGAPLHPADVLIRSWLFTPHSDRRCAGRTGPRRTDAGRRHGNRSLPAGLHFGSAPHSFWVLLQNVTREDQGRYCCMLLDFQRDGHHGALVQKPHSHVILQVTPRRNGSQDCSVWDAAPAGGSVPVALAVAACILALLSLPLVLVLVYKQRQSAHSSRRAQELVRMDSEAEGHENPVFLGGSPPTARSVSQIMARPPSETGRHLLCEPGTPLTPSPHGDVFFPIEDTIPESPDFLQV